MREFERIKRLPPYVFGIVNDLKMKARRAGEDIIDLGMGNPDMPTPGHVVDKLTEAAHNAKNHRYSASKGIYQLRLAVTEWYKRRYNVDLDPDTEAIATIGSKEGLAHLVLAIIGRGETALVPNPTYPIHLYSVLIAGGDIQSIPMLPGRNFFEDLQQRIKLSWPTPKLLILSFPHNPTTQVVELEFFKRVIDLAEEHDLLVIHDLAYADLVFDDYRAPSILEIPAARQRAVEFISLTKSYNMAGWRMGFCVGNSDMVHALTRIKSYLDYGTFQPIQIAAITALRGPQECVAEIVETYRRRRNVLCTELNRAGWKVDKPRATMFVWAQIPEQFRALGSLEFAKRLIGEAKVAVSPGIGFGEYGNDFVRFALVENEQRIRQAVRGIRKMLR
ncbi:MAG TPA: alanine transaminase [Terriglobia bacterium]|nr:alanine transaminase [Terriglobia bacterium]